jgi:hypothetical protein
VAIGDKDNRDESRLGHHARTRDDVTHPSNYENMVRFSFWKRESKSTV